MTAILIITHGEFRAYLLEAAEEIVGHDPSNLVQALPISRRLALSDVRERILKAVKAQLESSNGDGVLVLADMLGGTPCNETLLASRGMDKVEIVTGVNLYMIVSAMMNARKMPLEKLTTKVAEDAKRAVVKAKELLAAKQKC